MKRKNERTKWVVRRHRHLITGGSRRKEDSCLSFDKKLRKLAFPLLRFPASHFHFPFTQVFTLLLGHTDSWRNRKIISIVHTVQSIQITRNKWYTITSSEFSFKQSTEKKPQAPKRIWETNILLSYLSDLKESRKESQKNLKQSPNDLNKASFSFLFWFRNWPSEKGEGGGRIEAKGGFIRHFSAFRYTFETFLKLYFSRFHLI